MLRGNTKIYTQNSGQLSLWRLTRSTRVQTPDGYAPLGVLRKGAVQMYRYTIETYFKTYTLECSADTELKTLEGSKKVSQLMLGDILIVKGAYIPKRQSAAKSVSVEDLGISQGISASLTEYYANGLIIV